MVGKKTEQKPKLKYIKLPTTRTEHADALRKGKDRIEDVMHLLLSLTG